MGNTKKRVLKIHLGDFLAYPLKILQKIVPGYFWGALQDTQKNISKNCPENTPGDTPCRTEYPKNSPRNTFGFCFLVVLLLEIEGRRPSAAAFFEFFLF